MVGSGKSWRKYGNSGSRSHQVSVGADAKAILTHSRAESGPKKRLQYSQPSSTVPFAVTEILTASTPETSTWDFQGGATAGEISASSTQEPVSSEPHEESSNDATAGSDICDAQVASKKTTLESAETVYNYSTHITHSRRPPVRWIKPRVIRTQDGLVTVSNPSRAVEKRS